MTMREYILQNVYPVLLSPLHHMQDVFTMKIKGLGGIRVAFAIYDGVIAHDKMRYMKGNALQELNITEKDLIEAINARDYAYTFDSVSSLLGIKSKTGEPPLFTLTNPATHLGSGLICVNSILNKVAEVMHEDFYMIPSSIHEILIMPASYCDDAEILLDMVWEVNHTEVELNDRLSNYVYRYDYIQETWQTFRTSGIGRR